MRDATSLELRAEPDWLEAARQSFMWRYFYDDCGRVLERNSGADLRGPRVVVSEGGVRVRELNGTSPSERAA